MRLLPIAPTMISVNATEIMRRIDDNAAASARPSTAPPRATHSPPQSLSQTHLQPWQREISNRHPESRRRPRNGPQRRQARSLPPRTSRTAGAVSLLAVPGRLLAIDVAAGYTTVDRRSVDEVREVSLLAQQPPCTAKPLCDFAWSH